MINVKSEKNTPAKESFEGNICDFRYLSETMGGKEDLIKEIIDTFLKQVPEHLSDLNDSISKSDYSSMALLVHTLKSSVSIMGISLLTPVLHEMEELATNKTNIERIKELNDHLNGIFKLALEEIEKERLKYT
jgi:HPt (histidine-containing phosphotransfer) domain-containing protein